MSEGSVGMGVGGETGSPPLRRHSFLCEAVR